MNRAHRGPWARLLVVIGLTALAAVTLDLRVEALDSPAAADRAWGRLLAFARGFSSPDLSGEALRRSAALSAETLAVAVVGTALGAVVGLALGVVASRSFALGEGGPTTLPTRVLVASSRTLLDVLRAIPDFAWALLLLVPLGPGPVAGALAIAANVTGILGRVYGQLVDGVAYADVRAVETTGASRTAAMAYGRLPRIGAQAWSYTLVRMECSVRNASVIGVVGGGGLGAELFEELGFGHDDRVATLLLTLLVLTAGADLAASWTRRRLAQTGQVARRSRRHVAVAATAVLVAALVWLVPAIGQTVSRLTVDDGGFAADAVGRLLRPDMSLSTWAAAMRSSAVPLAMAWLATLGSAAAALAVVPWASSVLTRRAGGDVGPRLSARWLATLGWRALALVARAVPDVAWLLLLAAALRMSHVAAVAALGLHSFGVLVRVLTEAVDDAGVRDRVDGPGGRVAWLSYRLLPSVRSTVVTHTVLQGESNLRAAVVLGIVGAGGLGDAFHSAIGYWHLSRASTLAVVMVLLFVGVDRLARRWARRAVRRATAGVD